MKNLLKVIVTALIFFLIDLIWIGYFASNAYQDQIQSIQGDSLQLKSDVLPLIYFLIGTGIVYLVIPKLRGFEQSLEKGSINHLYNSFLWGGLLGLITYGVFDLTNYAIFNEWNPILAIGDILWGTFLTGLVTYLISMY